MQFKKLVFTLSIGLLSCLQCVAAGKASHVVVMVWDGMRADFVSPETTPTLAALASNGVTFLHHHPVYPSLTEANTVAISTGVYPRQSGLLANNEYRPALNPLAYVETDDLSTVRKGDEVTGDHYLEFPTIAEILHTHGLPTIVAGTKPVALLHDRAARPPDALGIDVFAGHALPEDCEWNLRRALGKFPPIRGNKIRLDRWTTRALTDVLWAKDVSPFSLLWMAEPDYTQHHTGPGSPASLAAIKSSDSNLRRVLDALEKRHLRDSTDIIVVSDHGFSTILQNIDISKTLRANGFNASTNFGTTQPKNGDIMVVGNGGEISCYVVGHQADVITRLAHFLQTQPFAGVIFTQEPVPGTFKLSDANINTPNAPDVALSVRWTADHSKYGVPGFIYDDGGALGPGQGQHASLDPFDMHNICFAAGPDFVQGMKDSLPTGNMDVAPTVLWILGIEPEKKMSGRVLSEALNFAGPEIQSFTPHHEQTEWKGDGMVWRQYLDTSVVNGEVYLDQGNGAQSAN